MLDIYLSSRICDSFSPLGRKFISKVLEITERCSLLRRTGSRIIGAKFKHENIFNEKARYPAAYIEKDLAYPNLYNLCNSTTESILLVPIGSQI